MHEIWKKQKQEAKIAKAYQFYKLLKIKKITIKRKYIKFGEPTG